MGLPLSQATVLLTLADRRRVRGTRAGLISARVVGNALYVRKASTDQLFVFRLTLALYGLV